MTQANNRHGADWTKAPGDGDGPPGGGTESNRARAARGGFTFPGPALKVGESAILRLDNTGPEPVASASRDGGQTWEDAPAAPPTCALTLRWDGRVHEIPYDQADTVAQMAAKVAAATGGKVSGGTVEMPVPRRPTSAAWSGAVPGPVVSLPSTLAEAEQFYGKGSPVWAAVHARVLAGVAPPLAGADGPLQYGRPICGHREMVATQADLDEQREAIAADNRIRARAGLPLLDVPHPAPHSAPGQVWLPPPGATNAYARNCDDVDPLRADADGTLTVAMIDPLTPETVIWNGTGETRETFVEDLADPAGGWTCIGVATPHGRVMVGDGFLGHGPGAPECEVVAIGAGDSVLLRAVGGWEAWVNAGRLANPREDSRTRYAPARAGERYRHRTERRTVQIVPDRQWMLLREEDSSDLHALRAGGSLDPAQWERLDPGAADGVDARASLALDGARRPGESLDDYKVRMVLRIKAEQDRLLAAASPLTATGADLDDLARRLYGIDRRPAKTTAYRGGTDRETDESLRARCLERLGLPATDALGREGAMGRPQSPVDDARAVAKDIRAAERAKETLVSCGDYLATIYSGKLLPPALTLQAPARDLRALFDAIGRALESTAGQLCHFAGHVLRVHRDELLFTPTWSTGIGASLCADARALCALRATVGEAMVTGSATLPQWGAKGPALVVRREGPPVASPVAADPAAPRYDGANSGADQWRWGVGE